MRSRFVSVVALVALCSACPSSISTRTTRSNIDVNPPTLDFGTLAPGKTLVQTTTLMNSGVAELHISELVVAGPQATFFTLEPPTSLTLGSGTKFALSLTYAPTAEGTHVARLLVRSDASNTGELAIVLTGHAAIADPCANIACNKPPGFCFKELGSCTAGACTYAQKDEGTSCDDGNACTDNDVCKAGACQGTPKSCLTPPAASCTSTSFLSYASPGICTAGTCSYTPVTSSCLGGCAGNVCATDPCIGVVCNKPPSGCFKASGSCVGGACQYQPDVGAHCSTGNACVLGESCDASGACVGTPKSCATPPAASCSPDGPSRTTADVTGTCVSGVCSYTLHNTQCVAPANGSATCASGGCGFSCNVGFGDCDPAHGKGCIDTTGDVSNCGACAKKCDAGALCVASQCMINKLTVTAIAAGGFHTCALVNGGVQCWGANVWGELGNNSTTNSQVPISVPGLTSGVSAISAGNSHTCALVNSGVRCWGYNFRGVLGNNSTKDSPVPVSVLGLTSGVSAISAGFDHSCALVNGGVQCWGWNASGQLGNNSTTNSHVPVSVLGLTSGVSAISAGWGHACALLNGGVQCWGFNSIGELGNNSTTESAVPVSALGLTSGVSAISTGWESNCALLNGGVQCWGDNVNGQLGNNSRTDSHVPVSVIGLQP